MKSLEMKFMSSYSDTDAENTTIVTRASVLYV